MYIYLFFRFQYKINDGKTFMSQLALNMNELQFMDNHKKLKLKGIESSYPSLMPSFSNLTNLKSLVISLLFNICHYIYV